MAPSAIRSGPKDEPPPYGNAAKPTKRAGKGGAAKTVSKMRVLLIDCYTAVREPLSMELWTRARDRDKTYIAIAIVAGPEDKAACRAKKIGAAAFFSKKSRTFAELLPALRNGTRDKLFRQ